MRTSAAALVLAACSVGPSSPLEDEEPGAAEIAVADWQVIARHPMTPIITSVFNGRYRSEETDVSDDLGEQPTEIKVVDLAGDVVLTHTTPGRGWFAQDEWVTEDFLVVEEINDPRFEVRIVAYDLLRKERLVVPRPRVTQPEMDASEGVVAYISGRSATRMCVQLLDLAAVQAREAACVQRGQVLSDVAYNAGRVVYSVIDRPNQKNRCKTVWVADPGAQPRPLPTQQRCVGWSGAVIAGTVAWDEADPFSERLAFSSAFMQSPDGTVRRIGQDLGTDSLVGCGDHFYWDAEDERGSRIDAMDRAGGVSTAWGPSEDWSPAALVCADNRWLQMSIDDLSGNTRPTEFLVRDLKPALK